MPSRPDDLEPQADLATMLAEMDSRLQVLQQELESVALPIARRPPERRAPRPATEPDASVPDPASSAPAPAAAAIARPGRVAPREPEATPALDGREPLSGTPRRPPRRIAGAARNAPAPPADPAPRSHPSIAVRRADLPPPPPADTGAPGAVVRTTILEAEDEARRIVDDARQRIAEIGARTRALLEHSLAEPPEPAKPAPARRRNRSRTVKAARRSYEGTVVVEAGPFADVAQLSAFEDALTSVPAVHDVYIRTFERNRAHFELNVAQPMALIVELQARTADTLNVVASGDGDVRLDIVRDGA